MTDETSIISLESHDGRRSEASEWLAKLDRGDLTEKERRAFAAWLAEDPENKRAIRAAAAMWYGLNKPISEMLPAPSPARKVLHRRAGFRIASVIAASVVFAFVVVGAITQLDSRGLIQAGYYSTAVGETKVISLDDGTNIHLNTNSSAEQAYSRNERLIRLLSGEAIFDVASDADRPFVVYASDGVIRAVGTRFAVRVVDDRIQVTVTEGRVAVEKRTDLIESERQDSTATASSALRLTADQGEVVDIDRQTGYSKRTASDRDVEERLSWASGKLVFRDKDLDFVIREVARYTTVRIEVADPQLRNHKISGILPIGDVDVMLEGIEGALGIKAKWISDTHVRLQGG